MIHNNEGHDRIYNRPHSHPYENDRYLLPSDQQHATQRTKEVREANNSSRPTSAPNLNFDCSVGALHEMTGMAHHTKAHEEISFQYNDDGMIHNNEGHDRIYNRPHSHPYENDRYLLPSDQQHATQRTKEVREANNSSRPTSAPNLNFDCSMGALHEMTEMAVDIWDSTTNKIANHINGKREGLIPVEDNKPKKKENEACKDEIRTPAPPSMFACQATEFKFNSIKNIWSRGEDSLQSMEMEDFSSGRLESNGSIGGQSLINVFDGDSVRNRDISEKSMMSFISSI